MPYAAAVSEHPDGSTAAAEAADEVLATLGLGVDAAIAFFTGVHAAKAEEMASIIRDRLLPGALLGASAVSVVAGSREIESTPAVSLWAGNVGPVRAARFRAYRGEGGLHLEGPPADAFADAHTLIVIPDPFTYPADLLIGRLREDHPHLTIVGGLASAGATPGSNRLILDDEVFTGGAAGLLLSGPVSVTTVVSQGCRPIGKPMTVTGAQGHVLVELAGRPAYEQVTEMIRSLDDDERELARRGLHIGRVIDERRLEYTRGDFLIRGVIEADRRAGTITVGDIVPLGATVQFQVRDARSADADLRELMSGADADGALVFTCNGRGTLLFETPNHDASVIASTLGDVPTSGMFCAGELGPVGPENFLHGYTASVALFHEPRTGPIPRFEGEG